MSFRGLRPPGTPLGLCQWTLLGDFRPPNPLCPLPSNPGYATGVYRSSCQSANNERQVWLSCLHLQIISCERTMRPADTAACPRYPTADDTAPSVGCTMTFDLRLLRHSRVTLQQTLAHSRDCICAYILKLTMR